MSLKDRIVLELERLPEAELQRVAHYLAFLRYHEYCERAPGLTSDSAALAALYAEFADEDRRLADEGIGEYSRMLAAEDSE